MSDPIHLGALLRADRERAGLAPEEAAGRLGVSAVTLRSWEVEPDKLYYRRPGRENLARVFETYATPDAERAQILGAYFEAPASSASRAESGAA